MLMNYFMLFLVAVAPVPTYAQRAIEKGSVEAFNYERRYRSAAIIRESANQIRWIEIADDKEREPQPPADTPLITKTAQESRDLRQQAIEELYKKREAIRDNKAIRKNERASRIKLTNEQILRLASPSRALVATRYHPPAFNEITYLDEVHFLVKVFDISSDDEMLVDIRGLIAGAGEQFYWMKGFRTENLVDNQRAIVDGWFAVTGKESYLATDGGRKSVLKIEPIDIEPIDIEPYHSQFVRSDELRSWSLESEEIAGALVLYDLGKVTIEDMSGKQTIVKITSLTDDDQEYIRNRVKVLKPRRKR